MKMFLAVVAAGAAFALGVLSVKAGMFTAAAGQSVTAPSTRARPARKAPKRAPEPLKMPGIPEHAKTKTGFFHKAPAWVQERAAAEAARVPAGQIAADTPYLNGVLEAPELSDVTVYDPDADFDGLNLVVSAHRPEASLMDMKGHVLHTWSYDFLKVWPEPLKFFEWAPHKSSWRRVHLYPNGDLLAIFEGIGMIKLDVDSNLLWSAKNRCHHDICVGADGRIYTLSRSERRLAGLQAPVLDDAITVMSPAGKTIRKISLLDAVLKSPYRQYASLIPNMSDIFHANTVELLDGRLADRIPAFKRGNMLVSVRNIDLVAVVDMETERVCWAMWGMWHLQHQPTVLDNGDILLFDNLGQKDASKVLEIDPRTQEIVWQYQGTQEQPFESPYLGSCQRLPNGNTLITESVAGRGFEVTPDKRIVWEWLNPHRAGDHDELIATLCEVVRIPWDSLDFAAVRQARGDGDTGRGRGRRRAVAEGEKVDRWQRATAARATAPSGTRRAGSIKKSTARCCARLRWPGACGAFPSPRSARCPTSAVAACSSSAAARRSGPSGWRAWVRASSASTCRSANCGTRSATSTAAAPR